MKKSFLKISLVALTIGLLLPSSISVFGQDTGNNGTNTIIDYGWQLVIDGAVAHPLSLSIPDIASMPKTKVNAELWCEGLLIDDGDWGGVLISTLLEQAEISPDATNLEFHASDGYRINVSTTAANSLIVAYELDGQPLTEMLRLVLPDYPGYYWISSITKISVTMSTDYNVFIPPTNGGPITTPIPAPTMSPKPTSSPSPVTTQQPTSTPQPSQTPILNVTATPSTSPSPATTEPSTPSSMQTTSPVPTENQPTSSPTAPQLGAQQTEPGLISESSSPFKYENLAVVAAIVIAVFVLVIFLRRKNSKTA